MKNEIVVVGAGFRGFCACVRLLGRPNTIIHLIDPSPKFGGVMSSRSVGEFFVDFGVQMFESIPQDLANLIIEIMDGQVEDIDFVSQSAFQGKITENFSLPDLSSLNELTKNKITSELITLAAKKTNDIAPKNISELFLHRYGNTAGEIFSKIFESVYLINPNQVAPSAIDHTSLGRLKYLDDAEMRVLKSNPWLDNVLAARRKTLPKIDNYVSIYPGNGKGMKGFCEKATSWLEKKEVKLNLGQKIKSFSNIKDGIRVETDQVTIDAEYVIWANDNVEHLAELSNFNIKGIKLRHFNSMVLMTLVTQKKYIKNFTYLQDFTPETSVFRVASAGLYSRQFTKEGYSFITCECPAIINGEDWINSESWLNQVWEECKSLGVIEQEATLITSDILRVEKAQRLLLAGVDSFLDELNNHLAKNLNRLEFSGMDLFNRQQIYLHSENLKKYL